MKSELAPIKILLVESQPLTRLGFHTLISSQPDMKVVAETASGEESIKLHRELQPDVTLFELRTPDLCGVDAVKEIKSVSPDTKIIICAAQSGDAEISRALKNGASGYILKDAAPEVVLQAIRAVYSRKRFISPEISAILSENLGAEDLTPAEQRITEMIIEGHSNKEIAAALQISENTVKTHLKNIFEKLGVDDRTAAAMTALRRGIVRLNS